MGEDTKKPNPQSTTTPSSQEQQQKKEATTQAGPPDPAAETAAQKQDETDILQTLLQQTSTPRPFKDSKVRSNDSAASPPTPPDPPNNSSPAAAPPDPTQLRSDAPKQGEDKGKSWVDVIKDSVTILGGLTVVIVALFVFLGRRYAEGYFNALHIPIFSISFSIWDYSEIGFLILILVIIVILSPIVILSLLKVAIDMIFVFFRQKFQYRLRKHISTFPQIPKESISPLSGSIKNLIIFWVILAILIIFMGPIVAASLVAYNFGERHGYQYIQERAMGVRLTSKESFLIPAPTVATATATANDEPTYTYEGLYLLTDNDRTYFLFDDVDEMCSPTNVYIVQESQLLSVEFISETFSKSCTPPTPISIWEVSTPIPPTPTVTSTTVPTTTPTPQATPTPMP